MHARRLVVTACAAFCFLAESVLAQTAPVRSVERIAGEVYHFRNNNHFGVVAVTADGIILVDPISADAGTWLKLELAVRFPGKPVKTIIYSHHDGDHSGGAEVFADTVTEIVATRTSRAAYSPTPVSR